MTFLSLQGSAHDVCSTPDAQNVAQIPGRVDVQVQDPEQGSYNTGCQRISADHMGRTGSILGCIGSRRGNLPAIERISLFFNYCKIELRF